MAQDIQQQIDEINHKLDLLLEEMSFQRRHRKEMDDLKDDLTRVGKDVYNSAVLELEEVHDYIQTGDMLYLFKKLLRNVRNLTKMFEQLENARDFVEDFSPISRELFTDLMTKLHEFEQKGYFEFVKGLNLAADNVVTKFSSEDVRDLSNNIVSILNTIKNLTQPDMLYAMNNAVEVYKHLDIKIEGNISLYSLLKELNSPELKRGLAFAIQFLKNLSRLPDRHP